MTIGLNSATPRVGVGALLLACLVTLTACGNAGTGGSQVVASVGSDEITETQVNRALERQAGVRPDQVDGASRKAVSNLVEQSIVLQKAHDLKLDRDERVMQNIEAAKRELVVSAYLNRIAEGAAKPTDKDIQAYYDDNPNLFGKRRVYTFQELAIDVQPSQFKDVETQLAQFKSAADIGAYLKERKIPTRGKQTTLSAENIPLALLARVAALVPGQGLIVSNEGGMRVLLLNEFHDAPMTPEQARPVIGTFLVTQGRRQAVQKELASLQTNARVAYFGKYADMAASAPAGPAASSAMGVPVASVGAASAAQR